MVRRITELRFKRALRHVRPSHLLRKQRQRSAIDSFAEKAGLVYFGFVDQRDDDHRLIRGHTVSPTHQDNHYCIGTVRGYDVMLVLRNDVVRLKSGKDKRCHWLIFAIDLHTKADVPHCYVGYKERDDEFAASFSQLHPLAIGGLGAYPHAFASSYTIYGAATHALQIESTITPHIAQVIATHFAGASVEIEDSMVYLYAESPNPTEEQMDKMLGNGLWLAEAIDTLYSIPSDDN